MQFLNVKPSTHRRELYGINARRNADFETPRANGPNFNQWKKFLNIYKFEKSQVPRDGHSDLPPANESALY